MPASRLGFRRFFQDPSACHRSPVRGVYKKGAFSLQVRTAGQS
ncbi:hypothetical protein OHAE_2593 [Ochrobactrum soli]|uniref:Uncharacterized protein n=1 Tax=Ochrobactrum soli TaxID=2448455 RepID=A0A2P9HRF4_9HYPH|nr:hypothetical protein OHAE_2593 [[Ochrobactrum] soli]